MFNSIQILLKFDELEGNNDPVSEASMLVDVSVAWTLGIVLSVMEMATEAIKSFCCLAYVEAFG